MRIGLEKRRRFQTLSRGVGLERQSGSMKRGRIADYRSPARQIHACGCSPVNDGHGRLVRRGIQFTATVGRARIEIQQSVELPFLKRAMPLRAPVRMPDKGCRKNRGGGLSQVAASDLLDLRSHEMRPWAEADVGVNSTADCSESLSERRSPSSGSCGLASQNPTSATGSKTAAPSRDQGLRAKRLTHSDRFRTPGIRAPMLRVDVANPVR